MKQCVRVMRTSIPPPAQERGSRGKIQRYRILQGLRAGIHRTSKVMCRNSENHQKTWHEAESPGQDFNGAASSRGPSSTPEPYRILEMTRTGESAATHQKCKETCRPEPDIQRQRGLISCTGTGFNAQYFTRILKIATAAFRILVEHCFYQSHKATRQRSRCRQFNGLKKKKLWARISIRRPSGPWRKVPASRSTCSAGTLR